MGDFVVAVTSSATAILMSTVNGCPICHVFGKVGVTVILTYVSCELAKKSDLGLNAPGLHVDCWSALLIETKRQAKVTRDSLSAFVTTTYYGEAQVAARRPSPNHISRRNHPIRTHPPLLRPPRHPSCA